MLFHSELSKKIPLLEARKKEYETIVQNYNNIRKKLDLSVLKNNKINDELRDMRIKKDSLQRELRLFEATDSQTRRQLSAALFLNLSLKRALNATDPLLDLMRYSVDNFNQQSYTSEELQVFSSIEKLQIENEDLRKKLNEIQLNSQLSGDSEEIKELREKIGILEV